MWACTEHSASAQGEAGYWPATERGLGQILPRTAEGINLLTPSGLWNGEKKNLFKAPAAVSGQS